MAGHWAQGNPRFVAHDRHALHIIRRRAIVMPRIP
jgi:hypothetical protein